MSMDSLTDDMAISRSGFSFLVDPDNVSVLDKYRTDPVRNLEAQPGGGLMVNYPDIIVDSMEELRNMDRHTMKKTFTPLAAEAYNNSAVHLLELLLVIILMAAGLPPYGNDLLHIQVINDEHSRRGIYIRDGMVEIITSDGHPTRARPAVRHMPDVVGKLIVLYLLNVLPLTKQKESPFLFANRNGRGCWSRGKYEEIIERETAKGLGVKLEGTIPESEEIIEHCKLLAEEHGFSVNYTSPSVNAPYWLGKLSGWPWLGPRYYYASTHEDVATEILGVIHTIENKPVATCKEMAESRDLSVTLERHVTPTSQWRGAISGRPWNGTTYFHGDTKEDIALQIILSRMNRIAPKY
ncbi:hypothetical protein V498_05205 [Pseudogymnoascus sp. VKM F-4517 (FW-2822)]|nr:hypothetical protein V498_05205 [Pseudogymnoascus sp. VKM F-4517 (FW-2822)]